MASYHISFQIVGRSDRYARKDGKSLSSVAGAAYRARTTLKDERTGITHDYRQKAGLAHEEIMLPEGADPQLADRAHLWNLVESMEKRKDAQLCREVNMALPHELSAEQRLDLVRAYVRDNFTSRGMVADICLHDPVAAHGDDPRNHHAHVMLTLRQATASGLRQVKTREWNAKEQVAEWRVAWCDYQNEALRRAGAHARVDHRTLVAQRAEAEKRGDRATAVKLAQEPEMHVGAKAYAMARRNYTPTSRDRPRGPYRSAPQITRPLTGHEYIHDRREKYVTSAQKNDSWLSKQFASRRHHIHETTHISGSRRIVRYTTIDYGTRFEANMNRLIRNAKNLEFRISKYQRQVARLGKKRQWLNKEEFELKIARQQKKRDHRWLKILQKRRDHNDVIRAMTGGGRRPDYFSRRRSLLDGLTGQLDVALRGLLGMREKTHARVHQVRARGARNRLPGSSPTHGRQRTRPR